jgi:uncharacterized repeat protein (TIGR01451 family)
LRYSVKLAAYNTNRYSDYNPADNTATYSGTVQCPDLKISKTLLNEPALGSPITYQVSITNQGSVVANAVHVTDTTSFGATLTGTLASLAAGANDQTLRFSAIVPLGATVGSVFTNTVTARAANGEMTTGDNTFILTSQAVAPFSFNDPPCGAVWAPNSTRTITWQTRGVNWVGPSNTVAISYTTDALNYTPITNTTNTGSASWVVPNGDFPMVSLRALITDGGGQPYVAQSCNFQITGGADLAINKWRYEGSGPVLGGQVASFVISFTNSGPDAAYSVVITDQLPAGFTLINVTPQAGTIPFTVTNNGATVQLTSGATPVAPAGYTGQFIVRAQAPAFTGTVNLTNTALISSGRPDANLGNNRVDFAFQGAPLQRNLTLQLTCDPEVPIQSDIGCSATITNNGNTPEAYAALRLGSQSDGKGTAPVPIWGFVPSQAITIGSNLIDVNPGTLWPGQSYVARTFWRLGDDRQINGWVSITATAGTRDPVSGALAPSADTTATVAVNGTAVSSASRYGIKFTNIGDSGASATWQTSPKRLEWLEFRPMGGATWTQVYDVNQANAYRLHYANFVGALPGVVYEVRVITPSAGGVPVVADDNSGRTYQMATGPTLTAPGPALAKGSISGPCADYRTVVYATLVDQDGLGSPQNSHTMSTLVEPGLNCSWSMDIGSARARDLSAYFYYDQNLDALTIFAQGEEPRGNGVYTATPAMAGGSGVPTITLSSSQTATVQLQAGWNLIALPASWTGYAMGWTPDAHWLLSQINTQAGATVADQVNAYRNGWVPFLYGRPATDPNNFSIKQGESYFVYALNDYSWTYDSAKFPTPAKLTVGAGWNPLGDPYQMEPRWASQVLQEVTIGRATSGVLPSASNLELDSWNGMFWDTVLLYNGTIFGADFQVGAQEGLFLKSNGAGQWQSAGAWR